MVMTEREKAILWLSSFVKNKEPMTLIPKQLIRLMYEALTEQQEIVRCKDCKHGKTFESKVGAIIVRCEHLMADVSADWYCADGDREGT